MPSFSAASLARTWLETLLSPKRFRARLDTEEGIFGAVIFFFVCAALATAIDLAGIGVHRGAAYVRGAVFMELLRLFFLTGLVPFILGGVLYGVCWIAGSKAFIETGVHIASYTIGSVLPIAAVLRHAVAGRGLQAALAALAYGVLLLVLGSALAWRGRPELRALEQAGAGS